MKKKFIIILVTFCILCLTGCTMGIKSDEAQKNIIDSVSKGLKTSNYDELKDVLKDYNNDMSPLVGNKTFLNSLYTCFKDEYENSNTKEKFYTNLKSILFILEDNKYKDIEFRSKLYSVVLDKNSTIIDKLNLYIILKETSLSEKIEFYKKELINKNDIDSFINSNATKTINESGKGGYYDDSNNKKLKSQGEHYEGWHTISSSVGYSGDFAYEYIWDEWVDDTFYEIHHNNHYEIYYKGTKLDTTIDKIPENAYYASPYLFIYKADKLYVFKVDDEVYSSVLYVYPENNY